MQALAACLNQKNTLKLAARHLDQSCNGIHEYGAHLLRLSRSECGRALQREQAHAASGAEHESRCPQHTQAYQRNAAMPQVLPVMSKVRERRTASCIATRVHIRVTIRVRAGTCLIIGDIRGECVFSQSLRGAAPTFGAAQPL
jgi:hypothetical protein